MEFELIFISTSRYLWFETINKIEEKFFFSAGFFFCINICSLHYHNLDHWPSDFSVQNHWNKSLKHELLLLVVVVCNSCIHYRFVWFYSTTHVSLYHVLHFVSVLTLKATTKLDMCLRTGWVQYTCVHLYLPTERGREDL